MHQDVLATLDAEWARLGRAHLDRQLSHSYPLDPLLRRFASGSDVVSFLHGTAPPQAKDDVLAGLIRLAPSEPFAGKTVLQALVPGLKTVARRLLHRDVPRAEVWQLLLASAWERIATYPLERRPRRIAANLLLDTLHATLEQLSAERGELVEFTDLPVPAPPAEPDGDVEGLLLRAVTLGVLSAEDAELVLETRFDGVELADAARTRDASYNTLKLRRQRAERRLLLMLGFPPVPRGRQRRRSFSGERAASLLRDESTAARA